jgi:argininosuccinate lyase
MKNNNKENINNNADNKLWNKGFSINELVEKYTIGTDYILDKKLVHYDCLASIAHAKMLCKQGYIKNDELDKLISKLNEIIELDKKDQFDIKFIDEDCHTAIEKYLINELGDIGKKIHFCRSRNDQVLTALRLYYLDSLKKFETKINIVKKEINKFDSKYGNIEIPGFTHMQLAMPSSISLWSKSFIDSFEDNLELLKSLKQILNQSPLGSAAGYGVPVSIDKEYTAKLLGFSKVQNNPIYCQNSRAKFDMLFMNLISTVMFDLNKIASDCVMFSMPQFKYLTIPKELTTGSSIMPNKKNPDLLEIMRGNYNSIIGKEIEVKSITSNLISGYNRDIQLCKKSVFESIEILNDSLDITYLLFSKLSVNKDECKKAMVDELYATKKAYDLVLKGVPFRDAYKIVGNEFNK